MVRVVLMSRSDPSRRRDPIPWWLPTLTGMVVIVMVSAGGSAAGFLSTLISDANAVWLVFTAAGAYVGYLGSRQVHRRIYVRVLSRDS